MLVAYRETSQRTLSRGESKGEMGTLFALYEGLVQVSTEDTIVWVPTFRLDKT